MNEFIQRLKAERDYVQEKMHGMTKLLEMGSEVVDPVHRQLLIEQHAVQVRYVEILNERLNLLGIRA